jgi:natural product biosynthesis luciferase-like monooxygenase protein
VDFSLFYFADSAPAMASDRYRLLTEGAKFADTHGFSAVWTPERHFHEFGGQYPNPAVTSAAIATITERVAIRAGSVVAPLHHPVRIAEEWSVVDNLSGGRAGISFASGWQAVDFVLQPGNYAQRREILADTVGTVRALWRGEEAMFADGTGTEVAVRIYPPPVQPELPIWITSAGSAETFELAGKLGAGVLTHLLGQDIDDLATKISIYREAFTAQDGAALCGPQVALMVHTFLGRDRDEIREVVREPFSAYLRSSIGLFARALGVGGLDVRKLPARDLHFLVDRSFNRYFETSGLFGTLDDGARFVERLAAIGVDDVACLIDFGVPADQVLDGLMLLDELRRAQRSSRLIKP